jgi:formylglycine-generating enzyme required for sulfatase activity
VTWGSTLKNVSGDVGKNISAGQKSITWKVLEEQDQLVGSKIKFKVIAVGKKVLAPLDHEMIFVEGGTFQMGSNSAGSNEKPVHSVTLSTFYIGKYEVTQAQWQAVMGSNPSYFKDCDQCPIEQVSWNDVQDFIRKLNAQTGKNYRLPTEAEWEYAAKGGKSSKGYTYSGSNNWNLVAWYMTNSGNKTNSVGGQQANELGIYDMTGNVWEWCSDWYGAYNSYSETNPTGASTGERRVLRGGGWNCASDLCSSTCRLKKFYPDISDDVCGFRLVLPTGILTESKASNGLDSDAKKICEIISQILKAQEDSDLDTILLLQTQFELFMVEIEKKYPKGSEDEKRLEVLIKPCLDEFMDLLK